MGKRTVVSVLSRRALQQAMIHASRVPEKASVEPFVFMRALRSVLRMSQSQLARRSKVPRAHISRLEAGAIDVQFSTMRRLFDAMFCDLIVLPLARKRPGDALAEREMENPSGRRVWD